MTVKKSIQNGDARGERLRRLEERYRNELLGEEERLELREQILKLKRRGA